MESYKIELELAAVIFIDLAVFAIGLFWSPLFGLWLTYHVLGMLGFCYLLHTSVDYSVIYDSTNHNTINDSKI